MPEHPLHFENSPRRSLFANLLILTGLVLTGLFVGQFLGLLLAQAVTGLSLNQVADVVNQPTQYPGAWNALMWIQAGSSLGGFVAAPWLFWRFFEGRQVADFNQAGVNLVVWPLVFLLGILVMPFNGWVYELNQALDLPPVLQPVEDWMKAQETSLDELTKFLTQFSSPAQLLVGLLVVAVIPAVGEELLFRGVVQNLFRWAFGNVHVAIWLSAAIFSAIHFQFYGFFPRLILGALFGYLYAWTRNLGVAMFAHFVNNGITLVGVYLFRNKLVEYDIENTDSVPVLAALVSLGLATALLWAVRRTVKAEM